MSQGRRRQGPQSVRPGLALISLGLASFSFVMAATVAACLAFPTSGLAQASGLVWVHDARAERLLAGPHPSVSAQAEARRQTLLSLRSDPANATAWLRLAYLDSLQPNGLGEAGRKALARSYVVAPYGPDDTEWRLRFAFNHWTALDQDLRKSVLREFELAARHGAHRSLPTRLDDPAGRLAATLTLMPVLEDLKRAADARRRQGAQTLPLRTAR